MVVVDISKMKCQFRLTILFITLGFILVLAHYCLNNNIIIAKNANIPKIVWISSWEEYEPTTKYCDTESVCDIAIQSKVTDYDNIKAYIFYGSDFDYKALPLPRESHKRIWALYHEESPRNRPILMHEKALNLFNFSSTFSRYSDWPLTLQYINSLSDITSDKYFISTKAKNDLLHSISPILYLQSDCDTMTNRDDYIKELMKYVDVDSYGSCLHNKDLPIALIENYLEKLTSDEFLQFVARYKFTISFENGICNDYITEKLWRPIHLGSIPIYLGSPTVEDWTPNKKTIISVNDFTSPRELAEYINHLNHNDELYEEYLAHKLEKRVTNKRLIEMLQREDESNILFEIRGIEAFECFICQKVHKMISGKLLYPSVVSKDHYQCPKPISALTKQEDIDNFWLKSWNHAKYEAGIMYKKVFNKS